MAEPWPEIRHLEHRTRTLPIANTPADFILKSVALAENSQYVAELDKFVLRTEAQRHEDAILALWKESNAEKEKLLALMDTLKEKSLGKGAAKTATELRNFSWKQVIAEVQTARDKYRNEGNVVKKVFQSMCDNSQTFEHWLELLPDGDYASTISGAFVMVVKAARNMSDVQKSISETLASIPEILAHGSAYVDIYKAHSSEALVQKTAALYKSVLVSLQLIIKFFLKSSFKRGATVLVKGHGYEKELKDSIQNMKEQVLKLREEANFCLQKRIAEMDRKNDLRAVREQSRQELAKEELLLAIDSSTEITAQKVCMYLLRQLQSSPDFNVRTGGLNLPFEGLLQITEEGSIRSAIVPPEIKGPTSKELLKMLKYDDELHQKDVADSLTLGYTQNDAAYARATWVLHSPEMSDFLAGKAESKLLLVNGNSEATEFISPLSFVCAKITDLMSVSNHIITLTYFCGRHTDELREQTANARGMLASLVGQLLTQIKKSGHKDFNLDLSSVGEDDYSAIEEEDMDALFDIFRAVIIQLPKGTVIFCLVDSLSAYESANRKEDTIALMQKFARLVKKATSVEFKLLVTCPGRSLYADRWGALNDRRSQTLFVPEDL